MVDMEKYMKSISKRFEKQEENFKILTDKVQSLEVTLSEYKEGKFRNLADKVKIFETEYKERLSRLEDRINTNENDDIELQQVKSKSGNLYKIREIQEKFETISSTVDNLESLSSSQNNKNGRLQAMTSEQLSDVGNIQEQQVSTKKAKWSKVKATTVHYFKTISIPGVSKIVTTESHLLKLLWTVLILGVFGVGFYIISQAVADFNKNDKITNIERIYPESVTFPAVTICIDGGYSRGHYINGSLIEEDKVSTNLLQKFLHFRAFGGTSFFSFNNESYNDVNNHLDTFKINDPFDMNFYDCLRFNALTNRSVELFKANSFEDRLEFWFEMFYREDISENDYYNYNISSQYWNFFCVYIGDNSLNSFENLQYADELNTGGSYRFAIEKVSIETKLPEPYNPCKKSSVDEPYHQMDCIEACTYKEIKNKYNCTLQETLFSIQGLKQCELNYRKLIAEFSASCLKECPLESCFSEKFTFDFKSDPSISTYFSFKFRDLSSLNITQIPKTDPFTFLNNIGGGLGLFMGIAFPNLIEFFQFILELFLIIFIRKIN